MKQDGRNKSEPVEEVDELSAVLEEKRDREQREREAMEFARDLAELGQVRPKSEDLFDRMPPGLRTYCLIVFMLGFVCLALAVAASFTKDKGLFFVLSILLWVMGNLALTGALCLRVANRWGILFCVLFFAPLAIVTTILGVFLMAAGGWSLLKWTLRIMLLGGMMNTEEAREFYDKRLYRKNPENYPPLGVGWLITVLSASGVAASVVLFNHIR